MSEQQSTITVPYSPENWYAPMSNSGADNQVNDAISESLCTMPFIGPVMVVCPPPKDDEPPAKLKDPSNKKCNFDMLKIEIEGRDFVLEVDANTPKSANYIEVIAGYFNTKAKTSCLLTNSVGPCRTHKNFKSWDTGSSKLEITHISENKLDVELVARHKLIALPSNVKPIEYTITANRDGHQGATGVIKVYPDLDLKVGFGLNFGEKKTSYDTHKSAKKLKKVKGIDSFKIRHKKYRVIDHNLFKLSVFGEVKFDNLEWKLQTVFSKTLKRIEDFKRFTTYFTGTLEEVTAKKEKALDENIYSASSFSWTIFYPNVEIALAGKWVENSGKRTCGYETELMVDVNPLIGAEIDIDITDVILKAAGSITGGATAVIAKARKLLEKLGSEILKLQLTIGANISGQLSAVWNSTKPKKEIKGKIIGQIPISVELIVLKTEIDIDLKITEVTCTVDIGGGGKSGVKGGFTYKSTTDQFNFILNFLDIVIWVSAEVEIGAKKTKSEESKYTNEKKRKKGPKRGTDKGKESSTKPEGKVVLYKKEFKEKDGIVIPIEF